MRHRYVLCGRKRENPLADWSSGPEWVAAVDAPFPGIDARSNQRIDRLPECSAGLVHWDVKKTGLLPGHVAPLLLNVHQTFVRVPGRDRERRASYPLRVPHEMERSVAFAVVHRCRIMDDGNKLFSDQTPACACFYFIPSYLLLLHLRFYKKEFALFLGKEQRWIGPLGKYDFIERRKCFPMSVHKYLCEKPLLCYTSVY